MRHATASCPCPRNSGILGHRASGHLPKPGAGLCPELALCGIWPIQDKMRLGSRPAAARVKSQQALDGRLRSFPRALQTWDLFP